MTFDVGAYGLVVLMRLEGHSANLLLTPCEVANLSLIPCEVTN